MYRLILWIGALLFAAAHLHGAETVRDPADVARIALHEEPGMVMQRALAQAMRERGIAESSLPDPELELGLESVPVGTLALDRDPMSQLKLGVSQRFPPAGQRRLMRAVREGEGEEFDALARLRGLEVLRGVRETWIEWAYWREAWRSIRATRALLQQLRDSLETAYAAADSGRQALLLSELALVRLDERQLINVAERERAWNGLERWAGVPLTAAPDAGWPEALQRELAALADQPEAQARLAQHPAVRALDARLAARSDEIELARTAYRPQWGLSLGYGVRDGEEMDGRPLDDMYSAMLSVELPLNPARRQDPAVRAATLMHASSRAERDVLLRDLRAELESGRIAAREARRRLALYQDQLLPLLETRVVTARDAYQAGAGALDQWMGALEAELELRLQMQRARADLLRALVALDALVGSATQGDR